MTFLCGDSVQEWVGEPARSSRATRGIASLDLLHRVLLPANPHWLTITWWPLGHATFGKGAGGDPLLAEDSSACLTS